MMLFNLWGLVTWYTWELSACPDTDLLSTGQLAFVAIGGIITMVP